MNAQVVRYRPTLRACANCFFESLESFCRTKELWHDDDGSFGVRWGDNVDWKISTVVTLKVVVN
jgi:hypothetical protein